MNEKIYKPISCRACPAYRENTKKCWCSVNRHEIEKDNEDGLFKQWRDCIIDWDVKDE